MNITLRDKKVLVTGASGYLGSSLCRRLLSHAADVHGVSRSVHRTVKSGVRWWRADLAQDGAAQRLLEKIRPDYIFHLAGLPDGRREIDLVIPTFLGNAETTVRLLTAAADIGCERFIYCASMEEPLISMRNSLPHSPYSASKWVGTAYCKMFNELYGLPTVALRVFLTYGPGPQAITKLIPHVITSLLRGQRPRLSSGSRLLDVVYIDDVTDAFIAALESKHALGQLIEVGSGQMTSIGEIGRTIASLVGRGILPNLGACPDRPQEVMPTADLDRTLKLLDWRPRVSLEVGLKRTIDWYRQEGAAPAFLAASGANLSPLGVPLSPLVQP